MNIVELHDAKLAVVEAGTGPTLLLVHGFPLDHSMWQHQLEGLSGEFRVVAPDLRGFGKSSGALDTMTMEQLADDLAEMLSVMQIDEPVTFCGLSMGGYVGWQFWKRHASLLDRLILCDTRAIADSEEVARGRSVMAERVLQEGPAELADSMLPKLFCEGTAAANQAVIDETRQVILNTSRNAIAGALRGMAARIDMSNELAAVDLPTLVICGQDDAISPVDEMQDFATALPNAKFVVVPDSGHMSPLENPRFVNSTIGDFAKASSC